MTKAELIAKLESAMRIAAEDNEPDIVWLIEELLADVHTLDESAPLDRPKGDRTTRYRVVEVPGGPGEVRSIDLPGFPGNRLLEDQDRPDIFRRNLFLDAAMTDLPVGSEITITLPHDLGRVPSWNEGSLVRSEVPAEDDDPPPVQW